MQGFGQAYTINWTGLIGNNNATTVPTGIVVTTQYNGLQASCGTASNGGASTYTAVVQAAPGYNFTITSITGTAYASNAGSKNFQIQLTNNGIVAGPVTTIGVSSSCGANTSIGTVAVPAANQLVTTGNSATINVFRTGGGGGYSWTRSLTIIGVVSPAGPMSTLASSNPAVTAAYIPQATTSNVIYNFSTAITGGATTLNSLAFTTAGNYVAADIDKFQLWSSATNSFATATQVGTDITTGMGTGVHTFSALAQSVATAATRYYWITADVNSTAVQLDSIKVTALVPANLSYVTGTTVQGSSFDGRAQTIVVAAGKSTITNSAGPSQIPSTATTQATEVSALDFTFTDDGVNPSYDLTESKISKIVFNSAPGFNIIADWTQAILGAELTDGTTSFPVTTINPTSLIFSGIPSAVQGDLGFVGDDSSKNYSLKIWLKPSLNSTLPTTIDGKNFVFAASNLDFTIAGSQLDLSQTANSGFASDIVDVTATKLAIVTQPPALTDVNASMTPSVVYQAVDINSNRDLDYSSTVDIASTGTLAAASVNSINAALGLATFANIKHSVVGTGLVLNATSGLLTAAPASNTFIIYSSGDHFRSTGTLAGSWSAPTTWESSADSILWIPALVAPDNKAASITILTGDTVNITTPISLAKTKVKSGSVLTVNTTTYNIVDSASDDLVIENGGILLLKAQTAAIGGTTGTLRVKTGGKIVAAFTAANTTVANFYLYTTTAARVVYEDSAIFEVNAATVTLAAGASYFNTGATDMPILRMTNAAATFTASAAMTINGRLEANMNFTVAGAFLKTIRGGITGTGQITESAVANNGLAFESPSAILGGTVKLILSGTGATTGGLLIMNGLTIPAGANVQISATSTAIRCAKSTGNFVIDGTLDMLATVFTDAAGTTVINGTYKTANLAGFSGSATTSYASTGGVLTVSPGSTIEYNAASGTQNVSGRNDDQNLTISGTAVKTLSGPATVSGIFALATSLALSNSDLTVLPSTILVGPSSAAYFKTNGTGSLKQVVSASDVVFPVGNSTFNPATINNAGTDDTFYVRVMDDVLMQGTTGATVFSPVVKRSWMIAEGTPGGSNATLTFQWNAADQINSFDLNHVFVAHHNGTNWENYGINIAAAPAALGSDPYTASKSNVTSFSPFTVGSMGISPLAISLRDLTASARGKVNEINWSSATEDKGDNFILERSNDAIRFTTLATVNGKGNDSKYNYIDATPLEGVSYYRLKMTDASGNSKYSNTVSVNRLNATANIAVMPNPVKDNLFVNLNNNDACTLILTDMFGRTLATQNAENGQAIINMSNYAPGQYLLKCVFASDVQTIHITK